MYLNKELSYREKVIIKLQLLKFLKPNLEDRTTFFIRFCTFP